LKIPVGRGTRFGIADSFIPTPPEKGTFNIRQGKHLSDNSPLLTEKTLDLIKWTGKTFLCGSGEVLKVSVPSSILSFPGPLVDFDSLDGENQQTSGQYEENFLYECKTFSRWKKIVELLEKGDSFIALFPEQALAASFFALLPPAMQKSALLWPSTGGKKLQDAWIAARKGSVPGIVGGPGAVFAPLPGVRSIIVDEESSGAYRTYRHPFLNMRTVAARKALLEKASLTLSGRLPSSRVYLRGKPRCTELPPRENVKLVDLKNSFSSEFQGIAGSLPLSAALFSETARVLSMGKVALWLLDRKGYAGEVACEECGKPILCSSCGRVMAWEEQRRRLRCSSCGKVSPLPETCPSCRGVLLSGKRPGLEALLPVARATAPDEKNVLIWDDETVRQKGSQGPHKRPFQGRHCARNPFRPDSVRLGGRRLRRVGRRGQRSSERSFSGEIHGLFHDVGILMERKFRGRANRSSAKQASGFRLAKGYGPGLGSFLERRAPGKKRTRPASFFLFAGNQVSIPWAEREYNGTIGENRPVSHGSGGTASCFLGDNPVAGQCPECSCPFFFHRKLQHRFS
jgi:hypothetical protein